MDNLPKNSTNDLSAFAGTYPDESKKDTSLPTPPVGGVATTAPQSPFTNQPGPSQSVFPSQVQTEVAGGPVMTTVVADTISPAEPVETPPVEPPPPVTDNPFTVAASPPPAKKSGGGRRLFLTFIALVVLLAIGFGLFQVVGRLLTSRGPTTLTYWGLWEDEKILATIVAEYKKTHPNIEVVYSKQSPKSYRERLQAAIQRGEGPDLFRFHNTWIPLLKNDLAPSGKTGYTTADFNQTFYPVAQKDLVLQGNVYGVPLMFDGLGLFYNEDLLRAAGITPPTSWEDFRKAALALTVKDNTGQIVTAGAALGTTNNIEHYSDILGLMMLQNGADLKNPTGKEAQDALTFYHLFAEKPNNTWDETMDNSILAFANGKVAFIFAPSWEVFQILETNKQLKFQVLPVPQLAGGSTTWASYWVEGVSAKSKHIDAAWEFLKFLSSKQSLITLYTEAAKERAFGEPYARVDLAQTITNDPYVGAYINQAQTAQSFFLASRTFDNGINDRLIKYLEDAVNSLDKGVSVQEALDTAGKGFSQVLTSFGFSPAASK